MQIRDPPRSAAVTVGLFVPKPTRGADCQRCGVPDLGTTVLSVRWRPVLVMAIVTHLVTRPLASMSQPEPTGQGVWAAVT
jgi:hypothetical protein